MKLPLKEIKDPIIRKAFEMLQPSGSSETTQVESPWTIGDIKMHHSYNKLSPIGHGWMLCDGRQINRQNYDAEHGVGSWDSKVSSTILDGRYLPNFTNRYPVGVLETSKDGKAAVTPVGNASNTSHSHSHTVNSHTHDLSNHIHSLQYNNNYGRMADDAESEWLATTGGPSTNNSGASSPGTNGATFSIQPDSIEVQYYMRIK